MRQVGERLPRFAAAAHAGKPSGLAEATSLEWHRSGERKRGRSRTSCGPVCGRLPGVWTCTPVVGTDGPGRDAPHPRARGGRAHRLSPLKQRALRWTRHTHGVRIPEFDSARSKWRRGRAGGAAPEPSRPLHPRGAGREPRPQAVASPGRRCGPARWDLAWRTIWGRLPRSACRECADTVCARSPCGCAVGGEYCGPRARVSLPSNSRSYSR